MIVGLTGGIGAGKSTVLEMFSALGVPTTSADIISKNIVDNNKMVFDAIINKFHHEVLKENNQLDRKKIRSKIFTSPEDKKWLENLLHPLIKQKILEFGKEINYPYGIIEIPLLFEARWQHVVDRILDVDCSEDLQLSRTMQRDNSSQETALNIIHSQASRKERIAKSDDIIENTGDLNALRHKVELLHQNYLKIASSTQ